ECERPGDVAASCEYGLDFACAVSAGHIHGVQFHPEKSHHFGTQLLKNFAEL
ncbi:MAG: imidazole glycerol phosphate synthase subunit HisH, partial [Alphaproteobacteria bacterium]|nr:imidazole glycerol phosphate synthase subunit HisH [Alphaproteobacteria bacterium]